LITRARSSALILSLALLFAGAASVAENAAKLKELTSVIKGLALPCGRVVSAIRQANNEHVASCESGDRYRIVTGAEGRVVVLKL
jgi:hypothetical protein